MWVALTDGSVARIDAAKDRVLGTIPIGGAIGGIAAGGDSVWVAASGSAFRIDPKTNRVTGTAPAGTGPACLGLTQKGVWLADTGDGTVTRLGA